MDKEDIYTYTHNGMLFSHKKEILPFATTWTELDGIQAEDDKYCIISLTCGILKIKLVNITKKSRLTNIEQTSDYHLKKGKTDGQDRRKGLRGANCYV